MQINALLDRESEEVLAPLTFAAERYASYRYNCAHIQKFFNQLSNAKWYQFVQNNQEQ
jgi:hypothetical protein